MPRVVLVPRPHQISATVTVTVERRLGLSLSHAVEDDTVRVAAFKRDADNEVGDVQRSGRVLPGDAVVAVDGKSVELLAFDEVVDRLRKRPVDIKFARAVMEPKGAVAAPPSSSPPPPPPAPTPQRTTTADVESGRLLSINNHLAATNPNPTPVSTAAERKLYTAKDFEVSRQMCTGRRALLLLVVILVAFLLYSFSQEDSFLNRVGRR